MPFYRFNKKETAFNALEDAVFTLEIIRMRISFEGKKDETLWTFTSLCAMYQMAKDEGDEKGKKHALKLVNRWCQSFEGDAIKVSNMTQKMGQAVSYLQACEDVTKEEIEQCKERGTLRARTEGIRRGYISNGAW